MRLPRSTLAVQRGGRMPPAGLDVVRVGLRPRPSRRAGKPREACTVTGREGGKALVSLTWREVGGGRDAGDAR